MKNFPKIILILLFLSSCNHVSREVEIDLRSIGNEQVDNLPQILIADKRMSKKVIGTKEFGKKIVEINNDQNLSELINDSVIDNLEEIDADLDTNKIFEFQLLALDYYAIRGIFVGKSNSSVSIRVSIIDKKTNQTSTRNIKLENDTKHFIVSLSSTDEKNINHIINKAIDTIFADKEFLNKLIK